MFADPTHLLDLSGALLPFLLPVCRIARAASPTLVGCLALKFGDGGDADCRGREDDDRDVAPVLSSRWINIRWSSV